MAKNSNKEPIGLTTLRGLLKSRLASNNKVKKTDGNNATVVANVEVFSDELLNDFLYLSLSDFNQTPHFTAFNFEDDDFCVKFASILIEGAALVALASQALLEKGREFSFKDNGIVMNPPNLSDLMMTQYSTLINLHFEKLKFIKQDKIVL